MSGWIRLQRGWRDNEAFADDGPLSEREAWVWLIEKAAWKDCTRRNAKGEIVVVKRGQFHTSLRNLEKAWGWGKNKVARYLERLEQLEMIGTVAGQSGSMITVCNYCKYQDARDSHTQESGTVAGQSRDTQEEGITNLSSKEESASGSDKAFWDAAVSYLGPSKRALIGKWCKQHGQEAVAQAITAAQLARAVDPVPYVVRALAVSPKREVVIGP